MAKLLGVNGSPRNDGSIERMMEEAAKVLREDGVEVEIVRLGEVRVEPCTGCEVCSEDPWGCPIQDDAADVLKKMVAADGILIGSPVYFGGVTAQLKALFDRSLMPYQNAELKDKLGGALSCGGAVHGGQELTVNQIIAFYMTHDMLVVNAGEGAYGAMGVADEKGGVTDDEDGMASVRKLAARMARLLNAHEA